MGTRTGPRYPWVLQTLCALLAGAMIVVTVVSPEGAVFFQSPFLSVFLPFWLLSGFVTLMAILLPLGVYRRRGRRFRAVEKLCRRCAKPLPKDGFALHSGEPICEECAAYLESIEGQKLPRFVKGPSEHAPT